MFNIDQNVNQNFYMLNKNSLNSWIIVCYIINIIKYVFLLFTDLSRETRMILFDFSLFIGGIQVYTTLAFTLAMCWGLYLRILFDLPANKPQHIYWTKLFYIISERSNVEELDLHETHDTIINQFKTRAINIFKLTRIVIIVTCKNIKKLFIKT